MPEMLEGDKLIPLLQVIDRLPRDAEQLRRGGGRNKTALAFHVIEVVLPLLFR